MWRHWGSERQLWSSFLAAELGWGPGSAGLWLAKSMIHVWFYYSWKANFFPLGNECGKMAVTWQEWGSLHLSPNSLDCCSCQGLAPFVILPLSAPAALGTNMLKVSSHPRQKKKNPKHSSKNVIHFLLRGEGKNKRKNGMLRKENEKNSSACIKPLWL